jgi:hypothetical protein
MIDIEFNGYGITERNHEHLTHPSQKSCPIEGEQREVDKFLRHAWPVASYIPDCNEIPMNLK